MATVLYPAFRIDSEGQRVGMRRTEKGEDEIFDRHGKKDGDHNIHVIRRSREDHDNFYAHCGAKGMGVLEFLPLESINCEACRKLFE